MIVRYYFYIISAVLFAAVGITAIFWPDVLSMLFVLVPLFLIGLRDVLQKRTNILRNYPVIGHLRYMMQAIRPQIQQYFVQRDTEEAPFSREQWQLVKERATRTEDNLPFGTLQNVYAPGYRWISHSIVPGNVLLQETKLDIGGPDCKQPYHASRLNISAMSYGALSSRAILALNRGAHKGGFAHNTGEGGLSPFHLQEGGDLIWQLGSGYFSACDPAGIFSEERFKKNAQLPQVKMIELKLSQGAKPGHGGVLPGAKVTEEIAAIRGVMPHQDCISPARHSTFSTPIELLQFIAKLRDLSGGKPVGFKLCVGIFTEFMAICKAMLQTGIMPDFITVDGSEGGTGAAPMEFVDFVGTPLNEGLVFVDGALRGAGLRKHIKIIAAGKVVTGFDILTKIALGANMCNAARAMMFALGCVQSRKCHTNECPTGVATQDKARGRAIDVENRSQRVMNYHHATLENFRALLAATGVKHPDELCRSLIRERISYQEIAQLEAIYPTPEDGAFLLPTIPEKYQTAWGVYWDAARAERF